MGKDGVTASMAKLVMMICYCHLVGGNMAISHHDNQTHSWKTAYKQAMILQSQLDILGRKYRQIIFQ